MKQKGEFKISTGASSILMIFVVLCLTTFAVLSYVTANADSRLTEKAIETTAAYYSADSKAQTAISAFDAKLAELEEQSSQGSSYVELIKQTQFENDGISAEVQTSNGIYTLHFVVPVSEGQQLEVDLKLETEPSQAGRRYQITRYQSVVTREWEEDNLELWTGK